MQSGYASTRWPTRAAAERSNDFATALKCTDLSQVLPCMRSKTHDEVLLAMSSGQQQFAETTRVSWGPVVDGLDIPDQPRTLYENGSFNRVPVIMGATRDEGWAYVDRSFPAGLSREVYDATVETEFGTADGGPPANPGGCTQQRLSVAEAALAQITGDVEAVREARRIARLVERTRTPVYLYRSNVRAKTTGVRRPCDPRTRHDFVFGNNFESADPYVLNREESRSPARSATTGRVRAEGNPTATTTNVVRWAGSSSTPLGKGTGQTITSRWTGRCAKGRSGARSPATSGTRSF